MRREPVQAPFPRARETATAAVATVANSRAVWLARTWLVGPAPRAIAASPAVARAMSPKIHR